MPIPIYIIGSSNTDMVVKTERLPKPGETILGGTFFLNAGGKGANQAVAAARLGGNVAFVANLGNDLFGKQAMEQFNKENINTQYILTDPTAPSGVALINVDARGENCIAVAPGSNGKLTPLLLDSFFKIIPKSAFVLAQFEIPIETVEFIIMQCAQKSIPIIINPAPANKLKDELWKHVFAVTPNETEVELLTGIHIEDDASVKEAANILHEKGVQNVIITLGKRGAYWSNQKNEGFVAAPVVKAVDSTAAGDCFNGALVVALAEGQSLADAASFACQAASISVTRLGAQASMPFRKELKS